ncbi:DNA adenine methylase [Tenacibaculum maritimum]|uniref:DNA adenine methylase n=1 Tax=Tenacibaculum maritimum TaxID=107401 RepID=UPI0012E4C891|nr:DNA adenine methylase [Tenacibaculum maritimum]CAA0192749.1 Site-specific DNA methylase [Tenacibaculum maritimum]
MSGNTSKKIAFNYFGGKFSWLDYLYDYFPYEFIHLVDVFGGSFAVTLNYQGKVVKTANEINSNITNFFQVLRDHELELLNLLELTPCSKEEYNRCWELDLDKIEAARRFYVRLRQSFFSLGASRKNKGWHMAKTQCNAKGGETVSKWNNALPKLKYVAKELRKNIQITNYDFMECVDKIDFDGAFFYFDPPYPYETRASKNDYAFEFTTEQHIALAKRANSIKGMAMVSSYNSELYDNLYKGWTKIELPTKKNNIRSGEVQEVIWFNYPLEKTAKYHKKLLKLKDKQLKLF